MSYFVFDNRKVYYQVKGRGQTVLLIHGNTMSSKMFATVIKKYNRQFKTIRIDLPGHGKSDRVDKFNVDYWYYNSQACNALIENLGLEKLSVIGTSGGALVGLNLALEYPERVNCLIADSFEGEQPLKSYIQTLGSSRERDKKKILAKLIWYYMHGSDWKKLVDLDTDVNLAFSETAKSFFHRPVSELKVPALLTGSRQDEYCNYLEDIYENLRMKNPIFGVHMFDCGKHPSMITNSKDFFKLAYEFINKNSNGY